MELCLHLCEQSEQPLSLCHPVTSLPFHPEPTAAPTDLRLSNVDSTKVTLHWIPVDPSTTLGEFKEYRVRRPPLTHTIPIHI